MRFYQIQKIVLLFMLTSFLTACQPEVEIPVEDQQFFDLKAFFKKEQLHLNDIKEVVKKAIIDGQPEEKTVKAINFEEELALFIDSDINKIAWLDRYEIDSISGDNGQLERIVYQAKDDKLKTNRLSIHFEKEAVQKIEIIRKTSSIAADLDQELIYIPQQGYSIKSRQQTSLSAPHVLELDVQFVR